MMSTVLLNVCEDQEEKKKGFMVEIKPFSPNDNATSADNVDDIRTLVLGLHISPTGSVSVFDDRDSLCEIFSSSSKILHV